MYSNIGCWYLSGKDSASNPSEMTQVYLSLSLYTHIAKLRIIHVRHIYTCMYRCFPCLFENYAFDISVTFASCFPAPSWQL